MTLPALYIVRKDGWYAERTVWAIAGVALSTGTLLAWLAHPAFALLILGTGLLSLGTAFSGFCVMSTLLVNLGFDAKLRAEPTSLGGVAIDRHDASVRRAHLLVLPLGHHAEVPRALRR